MLGPQRLFVALGFAVLLFAFARFAIFPILSLLSRERRQRLKTVKVAIPFAVTDLDVDELWEYYQESQQGVGQQDLLRVAFVRILEILVYEVHLKSQHPEQQQGQLSLTREDFVKLMEAQREEERRKAHVEGHKQFLINVAISVASLILGWVISAFIHLPGQH